MINMKNLANILCAKIELMEPYDRYKFFLSQYYLAKYVLGKENFIETDCSGILSGALFMMGYNIRCTAQFFYDHIFLSIRETGIESTQFMVKFVTDHDRKEVFHLCPHIENGVYLDISENCSLMDGYDVDKKYGLGGKIVTTCTTSEKTLSAFSISLLASTQVDPELVALR